jgi:hypothetical protein
LDRGWGDTTDFFADTVGADELKVYVVDTDNRRLSYLRSWASDRPELPLAQDDATAKTLAAAQATPLGESEVDVVIEGGRAETMTVVAIEAVIHKSGSALDGTLVLPRDAGGETDGPVNLGFDLDGPDLRARKVENGKLTTEPYLAQQGLEVASGEKVRLTLAGFTDLAARQWTVRIDVLVGGTRRSIVVGDPKNPFRVTGVSARYAAFYRWAGSGLEELRPEDVCGADCRTALDHTGHPRRSP